MRGVLRVGKREMTGSTYAAVIGMIWLAVASCAPAGSGKSTDGMTAAEPRQAGKTLVAAVASEPGTLAQLPLVTERASFAGLNTVQALANANLLLSDDNLVVRPYLAEAAPQLNTESWRVFPDGRMETTWKLKPGLFWHDNTPLTAQDFIFAWQVYMVPDFGQARLPVIQSIEGMAAPDDRTLVISYRKLFQDAADNPLPPLPRHILESPLQELDPLAFSRLAFWSDEYVGAGPYRVDRWEPGAFIEGAAFDRYVLGRPRIDRVRIVFILDENTAIANLRAGEVQFAGDSVIRLENALSLQDWVQSGAGAIHMRASQWRAVGFQFRPEFANPRALLDLRVRKALAHTVDKQLLNETIYQGLMVTSDFMMSPSSEWGPIVEPAITKYPYDPRRAEQLMNEAGFTRGADGFFAGPDGHFTAALETANRIDKPASAMSSNWRTLGYDIGDRSLPPALTTDPAARVTYAGMSIWTTSQGERALTGFVTSQCPRADNNWRTGTNRGCWSNAEYDRLYDAFMTTLDRQQRSVQLTQLARLFTDEVPMISVLFLAQPYEVAASLLGVLPVKPEGNILWNMHEWELK
jgi:peptide/nickel transport system substrate-binding protein